MRILQVIHDFLPHHAAGSELYCFYLSRELARSHSVYLLFTEVDHGRSQYEVRRSSYFGLPYYEVVHNHLYRRFEDTYADPRMDRIFSKVLDEVRPDVVHLQHLLNHSIGYLDIARKRGIPVVFTLHDYWLSCPNGGQRIRPDLHVCDAIELDACGECIRRFGGSGYVASRIASRLQRLRGAGGGPLIDRWRSARIRTPERDFVRRDRFDLQGETREVLVAHPPARVTFRLATPARTRLRFGVGMAPDTFDRPGCGVRFEVRSGGSSLWSGTLDAKAREEDRRWLDAEVELPGAARSLELITHPSEGEDNRHCTAGWSGLELLEPPDAVQERLAPAKRLYRAAEKLLTLERPARRMTAVARRLERIREACRGVSLFLAPSPFLRDKMIEFGIPEDRIVLSDYGMPVDVLQPFRRRPSDALRFGYVGTLVPHKGVHVLVEAFAKLRERLPGAAVELRVHGNPAWYPEYAARLRAAAATGTHFLGPFDNRDALEIYANLDVLVVPSIWWENAPITIHEAILTGTPVIASDFGGMADFVREGRNGLRFRVGDADDLARRMAELVEDPARLDDLRRPAVPIKPMELDAAEMERRYRELLGDGSRRDAAGAG